MDKTELIKDLKAARKSIALTLADDSDLDAAVVIDDLHYCLGNIIRSIAILEGRYRREIFTPVNPVVTAEAPLPEAEEPKKAAKKTTKKSAVKEAEEAVVKTATDTEAPAMSIIPKEEPIVINSMEDAYTPDKVRAALMAARDKGVLINPIITKYAGGGGKFSAIPATAYPALMKELEAYAE